MSTLTLILNSDPQEALSQFPAGRDWRAAYDMISSEWEIYPRGSRDDDLMVGEGLGPLIAELVDHLMYAMGLCPDCAIMEGGAVETVIVSGPKNDRIECNRCGFVEPDWEMEPWQVAEYSNRLMPASGLPNPLVDLNIHDQKFAYEMRLDTAIW